MLEGEWTERVVDTLATKILLQIVNLFVTRCFYKNIYGRYSLLANVHMFFTVSDIQPSLIFFGKAT